MLEEKQLFDSQRQGWFIYVQQYFLLFNSYSLHTPCQELVSYNILSTLMYAFPVPVHYYISNHLQNHRDSLFTVELYPLSHSHCCLYHPSFRYLWIVFGFLPSGLPVSHYQFFISNLAIIPLLKLPF